MAKRMRSINVGFNATFIVICLNGFTHPHLFFSTTCICMNKCGQVE